MMTAERAKFLLTHRADGVVLRAYERGRAQVSEQGITQDEEQEVRRVWSHTIGTFDQALERIANSDVACMRCCKPFDKRKALHRDDKTGLLLCRSNCDGVQRTAPGVDGVAMVLAAAIRDLVAAEETSADVTLAFIDRGMGWVVSAGHPGYEEHAVTRELRVDSDYVQLAREMITALMTGAS